MTKRFAIHFIAAAAAAALIATPALATKAKDLQSLVGARGSSGESDLENRGFVSIDGRAADGGRYTYWWNARDKNCISVFTADGRYQSIRDASNGDCNQKSGSSGAAVAGVALGAILIAALASHKSDHHDDNQHLADQQAEAQYERGYNDGLHNVAYHNWDRSDAYSNGYSAGVTQREHNTAYQSRRGGYRSHVSLDGLQGNQGVWAIDEMTRRGFVGVDTISSGNTIYGIYYNRSTRQCAQLTLADNRVYDAREIGSHPRCR